jgi:hypothetical protein
LFVTGRAGSSKILKPVKNCPVLFVQTKNQYLASGLDPFLEYFQDTKYSGSEHYLQKLVFSYLEKNGVSEVKFV